MPKQWYSVWSQRYHVITETVTMQQLGMHIDSKLNLDSHVAFLCTKAGRKINVLRCTRRSLGYVNKMAIYDSFIITNFYHCPDVWMFTSKSSRKKTWKHSEACTKICLHWLFTEWLRIIWKKCGSQEVNVMTLCYVEMEVYECVKNMNPQYLNEMLILKKYRYDLGDNSLLD